ncbi:MAG TPA: glycoside hydrolase family 88 protein [Gemmatimonadaceae bacterium]|nr:glycoside hydrolase family 88 protein [Gemmatimonadaceae bacterium]
MTGLAALLAATASVPAAAQQPWSVRVANAVMQRSPAAVYGKWDYTAGLVLLGLERVGARTGDPKYAAYIKRSVDSLVHPDGSIATYDPSEHQLDQINEGRALFALSDRTHDPRYATAADRLREQLRNQPRTNEGGFWHKDIYPQQMWLDGLYMAEPFYAEYAARHRDTTAMTDVVRQFLLVARHTRDPKTGLFYHAWDAAHAQRWADPATGLSKNFWGRAVGWYLMGAMDVLDYLPKNHPDRGALIQVVQQLADAVAKVQDPVSGVWWQVLDQPDRAKNYLEASASAMFVYAFAKGARLGYLPPGYHALAERGFDGMLKNFVTVDANGLVSINDICKVAGLGGNPPRDGSYEYYVSEPVVSNDYKGVGAFILAANELGR